MKGYARYTITQQHRDNLKAIIDECDDWIKKCKPEKEKYLFFFTREVYDVSDMPYGVFLGQMADGRKVPFKRKWIEELESLYNLIKYKDEVFLGESFSYYFNRYAR